jgi:hypothetical protein
MSSDEGAASDDGFDQTTLSSLDVAPRDCGEVERQAPGQVSLRRQAVPGRQTPCRDVGRDRIGYGEIFRALATLEDRRPGLHGVLAGLRRPELTGDCWTPGASPWGAGTLQKLASISVFDGMRAELTVNMTGFTGF